MKKLILTRGKPGSGKSTFIQKHGLAPYTLSPDDIRLQFQPPTLLAEGTFTISSDNDNKVWSHLMEVLESRMKRGDFTVIDATHTRSKDFTNYKTLADTYQYEVICVDFSHVPIEQAKQWNKERAEHKRVPDDRIEIMQHRMETSPIPKWVKIIRPESIEKELQPAPLDFSHYKKIHIIGDIHGCYDALTSYMPNELPSDELFIFAGDYVDRGIQNGKVLNYLFSIMYRDNVILLEGNHEIHTWRWSLDLPSFSKREFERFTRHDLEEERVSKKTARAFYRNLKHVVHFTYGEKEVLVTHGGLPFIPTHLPFISAEQLIKGAGNYQTDIDSIFSSLTKEHQYQVHGHRNIFHHPVEASPRSFNVEGGVEMGGHLRIVTLDASGFTPIEVRNTVISDRIRAKKEIQIQKNQEFLQALRDNNMIQEKQVGKGISSFNFKKDVFYGSLWDEQNIKARGLFIHTETTEVVARSYDKFFNIESYLQEDTDRLF